MKAFLRDVLINLSVSLFVTWLLVLPIPPQLDPFDVELIWVAVTDQ